MPIYRAPVLICDGTLDSQGEYILKAGVDIVAAPLGVTFEFSDEPRDEMGFAYDFKWEGDSLWATIEIDRSWEAHSAGVELLVPTVGGVTLERIGAVIQKCSIRCLGLTLKPSDKRLKPLKEYRMETK